MGPAGPQGPPATVVWGVDIVDALGEAQVNFPGYAVGTSVINCYHSPAGGPWQLISDGHATSANPWCFIDQVGADLLVGLFQGVPGWEFLVTVISGTIP